MVHWYCGGRIAKSSFADLDAQLTTKVARAREAREALKQQLNDVRNGIVKESALRVETVCIEMS